MLKIQKENQCKDKTILEKTVQTQAKEMIEFKNKMVLLLEELNLNQSKCFSAKSKKEPKGTFNEEKQQN